MSGYHNDFSSAELPDLTVKPETIAPWSEQPITIPLNEWTELLLDNADLRARLDALALRWSDANERIRHLENDLAMMRGAMEGGETWESQS